MNYYFRTFYVEDADKKYKYTIHLCQQAPDDQVAVLQTNLSSGGLVSKIGVFDKSTLAFGGGKCRFGNRFIQSVAHRYNNNSTEKFLSLFIISISSFNDVKIIQPTNYTYCWRVKPSGTRQKYTLVWFIAYFKSTDQCNNNITVPHCKKWCVNFTHKVE